MYNLQRFLIAQETDYRVALEELTSGKKRSHYIWYIFPQLKDLGRSPNALYYGIENLNEAKAYLNNETLKKRLIACCNAMLLHKDKTALQILGDIDCIKLKSSMTLFALASEEENSIFHKVLNQFYKGEMDKITVSILELNN